MKEPIMFNGVHVAITLGAFFTGLVYGYFVGYIDRKDNERRP